MSVSVCIATYRRTDRLAALLSDLEKQHRLPGEVVIVDNDAAGSARAVVEQCLARGTPYKIIYDIQPKKNISLTRNRTVKLASGDWLAIIDDDERAPPEWLESLLSAATQYASDGVLGPVIPLLPQNAPKWILRGHFYDFPRMKSGAEIPPNRLRFGNVLLRGSLLHPLQEPFDPAYGLTGGEDGDLLSRLALGGAKLTWCDEAVVHEPVEASRLTLKWLLRRAFSGGQDFATHTMRGRYGVITLYGRVALFLRALLQVLVAAVLALLFYPFGKHHSALWLIKVSANVGKLSVFWGMRFREYA